jgi:hypothetical protein
MGSRRVASRALLSPCPFPVILCRVHRIVGVGGQWCGQCGRFSCKVVVSVVIVVTVVVQVVAVVDVV